ncbi:hypothetical protein SAMD00019534_045460 [Acytostelium subglobosum LB1]|uniref:hypothetical protein n=1 Tax=Acytostelium subglobosum LB1 TaxID=1410327 RepID=UPI000644BCE5|nr:hypothetical protein SAMD00019534_045460 [Acytostelium subglobosum LB1]GAM21371.1 hypothetical protein SAMD00019534_045460 [Acytostelium subglobosum LB1]|eukprot:XP_012755490.1 hypothetical protein SAMD00019534_045460 [Acytostelium subglobosum LB1]
MSLCKKCWQKDQKYYTKYNESLSNKTPDRSSTSSLESNNVDQDDKAIEEARLALIRKHEKALGYHHADTAPLPHRFTLETKSQLAMALSNVGETTYHSLRNSFRDHKDRHCIGTRRKVPISKEHPYGLAEFVWMTYELFQEETEMLGRSLVSLIPSRSFVGICANNCYEWYCADLACLWYGMPVVPIHHQVNHDTLVETLSNSETSCMFISNSVLPLLVDILVAKEYEGIKLIVQMEDTLDQDVISRIPNNVTFRRLSEMITGGYKVKDVHHNPIQSYEIFSLTYTSGSTGLPKGVIIKDSEFNQSITKSFIEYPGTSLSFATLSHSQRRFDYKMLYHGAKIGIFSGSMESLFDDLKELRPHIFWAVPRMWNLIYSQYQSELEQFTKSHPLSSREYCEEKVVKQFSQVLGNRVSSIVTGGAPTSEDVMNFMRRCWPKTGIANSYGLSEAIGIFVDGYVAEDIQFRLEPVPEFGYSPEDKPNPRGELVVKSATMSSGYYRNDQLTNDSRTEDGWFKTGDIVEQLGPRKIKIIDRKKNAFKLSNGEFVAPEPLENHFLGSDLIEQMFIYGNTLKTFLVAVVMPRKSVLEQHGITNESTIQDKDNCLPLKNIVMKEIQRIATEIKLANYEIPKIIAIDNTVWTVDNHLLTGSGKYSRNHLYQFYKERINTMYDTIDSIQVGLRDDSNNGGLVETYLRQILGVDSQQASDIDMSKLTFTNIGGDSLGAIRLSNLLKEKANITVSPAFILNNNNNLETLAKMAKENMGEVDVQTSFIDWTKEMMLDDTIQINGKSLAPLNGTTGNNVFLTGASGYLGSFLLYELLSQQGVDKVHCLVRGTSSMEEAKDRLINLLNKYKLSLTEQQASRIIPVLGCLDQPLFGLSIDAFTQLANQVNLILHNGAVVNMVIPYPNMKATNVLGTQEIIRLACAGSYIIRVAHVSTIGTFSDRSSVITEASTPTLDNLDMMNGYNQSKLIAEQLVKQAQVRGVPVLMFRPATVYANSATGVDNPNDFVRLLLKGILHMSAYPLIESTIGGGGENYNTAVASNIKVFHIINETSVSLDDLCTGISTMRPLKQVDYSDWKASLVSQPDNPLHPMSMVFRFGFPGFGRFGYKNPATITQLERIGKAKCPPVTQAIIQRNIEYLLQEQPQE